MSLHGRFLQRYPSDTDSCVSLMSPLPHLGHHPRVRFLLREGLDQGDEAQLPRRGKISCPPLPYIIEVRYITKQARQYMLLRYTGTHGVVSLDRCPIVSKVVLG